ncbi:SurA N-terminal domain-containing protein [Gilvimarinus polysaccharolyticus]|uniref:SurA N-terminal domain-containing protein n=1 Tax=Gilvimarinus polysaccharolyticus TaxID=863921 RepID=UPI0006735198|nr:SurA N-terminal domain-containing protein [Gilvimarinus polysaccharolyticus]
MLQTMRDNSKGVVAGILVGLLVIIFALSGAEALFSSANNTQTVMTINGQEITETEVARAIEQQKQQLRSRFGESVPESFLSNENLREPAIENLVRRTLLTQAAANADMTVSDARLNNVITSIPAFQDIDGKFDPNRYQQSLRMLAYTPASYKRELIRDLTVNQLASGVSGSNFVTEPELQHLIELNYQTRDFSFVTFSAEVLMAGIDVTDAEVAQYHQENVERFTVPETVTVEYIDLSVEQLASDEAIDDAELRKQYEQNIEDFTPSVERHAAHILLEDPSDELLAELQTKIDNNEDFATLAAEYSSDLGSKGNGGDLGISTGDAFPDDFEDALADLTVGEVSGPVSTDAGIHFIKLLDETGGEPTSFEEQKELLAAQAKRSAAESRFIELLDQLEDLSYNAESLASVAEQLDISVAQSEPFSRQGGSGISAFPAVAAAAFSEEVLTHGNASEVLELAPDRVVVVKKIAHKPSFVEPLANVKDDIIITLREQKAATLLAEKGQALQQRLTEGAELAELADAEGLEVTALKGIERGDMEQSRAVVEFAFSMARPQADKPSVAGFGANGEYSVVTLSAINLPQDEMPEAQKNAASQSLASLLGAADFASFQQYLEETADIERK